MCCCFQLMGVDGSALGEALTHKKLTAKGEEVTIILSSLLMFSAVCCVFSDLVILRHPCIHHR